MATSREGGTAKRTSPSRGSRTGLGSEVSRARWAGVALVMAAIVAAVLLAMISPSEPGQPGQPGLLPEAPSPSPSPVAADTRVPTVQPRITIPTDGNVTPEIEIAVSVDIPEGEEVPRRLLTLYIYNGVEIDTLEKPRTGVTEVVQGVRLTPGENTLTAALGGPGGPGPRSEPVVVILDEDAPKVTIVSPKNRTETYDEGIWVEFTSEVGAAVHVVNDASKFDDERVVGPSGEDSMLVNLRRGKNVIRATSIDSAGQEQTAEINVTRIDGRPRIKLKFPESVDPPAPARVVADVTDAKGKPMPGAEVHFSLGGPGRTTLTDIVITNDQGRAAWNAEVTPSDSPADGLELGVVVISPSGDKKTVDGNILLK